MKPLLVIKNKNNIIFQAGVEEMVYKTDINSFVEESGLTIQNINFPIEGYYVKVADLGDKVTCGNLIENAFIELQNESINNTLIVVDFIEVEQLSESAMKSYTKILLQSSNKIITINMDTSVSNGFSSFILQNIIPPIETEETDDEEEE